jgi:cytochrome c oxidase subunit II
MSLIHKAEKHAIMLTGIVLGVFVFSILYAQRTYRTDVPECLPFDKAYTEPAIRQIDDHTMQVFAVASMWNFEPSEIYVPVGTEVDFFLSSKDVVHGFNIAQKNVNMMAVYGSINKTTVKFDKPGVYDIVCHEFCGTGHQNMKAQVIVNVPSKTQKP